MKEFKHICENIRNYRWKSVYFSYFCNIFLCVFVIFIIYNIILCAHNTMQTNKDLEYYSKDIFVRAANNLDRVNEEVNRVFIDYVMDPDVKKFMLRNINKGNGNFDTSDVMPIQDKIRKSVSTGYVAKNIYILSFKNDYVLTNTGGGNKEKYKDAQWLKRYSETGERYYTFQDEISKNVFYVWYDDDGGIIAIELLKDSLSSAIHIEGLEVPVEISVANAAGDIIYADNTEYQIYDKEDIVKQMERKADEILVSIGKSYIDLSKKADTEYDFIYFLRISKNSVKEKFSDMLKIIILGGIVMFVLLIVMSLYFTTKMYNNIASIESLFSGVSKDVLGINEISYITQHINSIISSEKNGSQNSAENLKTLKKSKQIALQAQINPHFICNTLQMVNLLIMNTVKGDCKATRIISLLWDLISMSFDTKSAVIPITQEIEHVRKYIEIQNIYHDGKVRFSVDLQKGTENLNVVRMIMQPIVENSIAYAMNEKNGIDVSVTALKDDERLKIVISDNGNGMSAERLEEVRQALCSDSLPESSHIGLCNVNQRIQLIFGSEYGLSVKSAENKGTDVIIIMPETEGQNA